MKESEALPAQHRPGPNALAGMQAPPAASTASLPPPRAPPALRPLAPRLLWGPASSRPLYPGRTPLRTSQTPGSTLACQAPQRLPDQTVSCSWALATA